jgi:hypothetical protein
MSEIRARRSVTISIRALEPIRDAEDLHEIDLDAELWSRLPAQPASPRRRTC